MRAPNASPASTVGVALLMGLAAAAGWWWQSAVFRTPRLEIGAEAWDHVKQAYPIPETFGEVPASSTETLEMLVRANPFSPQRRQVPPAGGSEVPDGQGTPGHPPKPTLVYKGRINLGQRQRAIMEDLAAKKTYFLEVGQAVAGFKVLDITETQVVLSDPQTSEAVVVPLTSPSGRTQGAGGRGPGQTTKQDEAPPGPTR
ncbi:MAG: hypothetical protein HY599_05955 [Candidatus Omnitrophica bacterium]|nr:hypothetical protein [Candidatus Omnitrophota bacterium]